MGSPICIRNALAGLPEFTSKKAEDHFRKAIGVAEEIGARGEKDKAREYVSGAVQIFERCEAETFLRKAKDALEDLG